MIAFVHKCRAVSSIKFSNFSTEFEICCDFTIPTELLHVDRKLFIICKQNDEKMQFIKSRSLYMLVGENTHGECERSQVTHTYYFAKQNPTRGRHERTRLSCPYLYLYPHAYETSLVAPRQRVQYIKFISATMKNTCTNICLTVTSSRHQVSNYAEITIIKSFNNDFFICSTT